MPEGPNDMSGAKRAAWAALGRAKTYEPEAVRALRAFRRAQLIARIRLLSAWHGASTEVDIAPDVRLGRRIGVRIWPGSRNSVRIGPGSIVEDDVRLTLNNGSLILGDNVEIRHHVIMMLWGGTLEIAGENIISWGAVFHCADSIRIGRQVSIGEYSTIVDSTHVFTTPEAPFTHQTKTGPVEVGFNTWIAAKATISRNSKVGDHCIIASNAVVSGEVPSSHLASGAPATVRPLKHPWLKAGGKDEPV